jgi:two-component system chemotaxis response regulator CheB
MGRRLQLLLTQDDPEFENWDQDATAVAERYGEQDPAVVAAELREDTSSGLICPDCGGALWSVNEAGVPRFRCRVGHAYSAETLLAAQDATVETALWAAIRTLEERAALLRRMASRVERQGHGRTAGKFARQATDAEHQAEIIRAGVLPVPLAAEEAGS